MGDGECWRVLPLLDCFVAPRFVVVGPHPAVIIVLDATYRLVVVARFDGIDMLGSLSLHDHEHRWLGTKPGVLSFARRVMVRW